MKYLVDTCVLSELARKKPSSQVLDWFAGCKMADVFYIVHGMTVVTRNVNDFRFDGLQVVNPFVAE